VAKKLCKMSYENQKRKEHGGEIVLFCGGRFDFFHTGEYNSRNGRKVLPQNQEKPRNGSSSASAFPSESRRVVERRRKRCGNGLVGSGQEMARRGSGVIGKEWV